MAGLAPERYSRIVIDSGIALIGEDLEAVRGRYIVIENGTVSYIASRSFSLNSAEVGGETFFLDCRAGIVSPTLINSHAHTADIGFPEIGYDLDIDSLVGEPYGLKYIYLDREAGNLESYIYAFLKLSLESGVSAVADFREGGLRGFLSGVDASRKIDLVSYTPMYMPRYMGPEHDPEQWLKGVAEDLSRIKKIYGAGNLWIALSSPHYYSREQLIKLDKLSMENGIYIASHIAETEDVRGEGDFELVKDLERLKLAVHGYSLGVDELRYLSERGVYLAICPRSALWFSGRVVSLRGLRESGIRVVVGTDNGGWIKPDLWRELELLAYLSRREGWVYEPAEILKMATVYPGELFGVGNVIREGARARLMCVASKWINIESVRNPIIHLLKRGGVESVRSVVIGDRVVSAR